MAKKKKLTKAELEKVQGSVNLLNNIMTELGRMEVQKVMAVRQYEQAEAALTSVRSELEEKYGSVNIDLVTGEFEKQAEE